MEGENGDTDQLEDTVPKNQISTSPDLQQPSPNNVSMQAILPTTTRIKGQLFVNQPRIGDEMSNAQYIHASRTWFQSLNGRHSRFDITEREKIA